MLSDLEVGQFWTFGFTVLRGCLSEKEVDRLQETHNRVIADAPVYNYFAENGTRMLSPFVQADDDFRRVNRASRCDGSHARYLGDGVSLYCRQRYVGEPRRHPLAHRRSAGATERHAQDRHIPR